MTTLDPAFTRKIVTRLGAIEEPDRAGPKGGPRVPEPWLSADDIAAHLGVTTDTVYAWITGKRMPAHKGRPPLEVPG